MALHDKLRKLENGQALMEYWPTIPAAIMIIISASIMVSFLRSGFSQTADALYRSSAGIEFEICDSTSEEVEGPAVAHLGPHTIEFVGRSVNENGNTVITYEVTSGSPLIKSIAFDIPAEIRNNEIIDASESWSSNEDELVTGYSTEEEVNSNKGPKGNNGLGNGADPAPPGNPPENDVVFQYTDNDGVVHVPIYKTDPGVTWVDNGDKTRTYSITVGDETYTLTEAQDEDPVVGQPGNKGQGNGKHKVVARSMPNLLLLQDGGSVDMGFRYGEARDISFVLKGDVTFGAITVTAYQSQETAYAGIITGPIKVIDSGTTTTTIQGCK